MCAAVVLSSGDEDEEHDEARGDVRLNPDLQVSVNQYSGALV